MSTFVYELKRSLTKISVLSLTAVIIVFSVLAAVSSASSVSGASPAQTAVTTGFGYDFNGTVNATFHIINGYGQPVPGSVVRISKNDGSLLNVTSDSQGYAYLSGVNASSLSGFYNGSNFNEIFYTVKTPFSSNAYGQAMIFKNASTPYFFHYTNTQYNITTKTPQNVTVKVPRFSISSKSILNQPDRKGISIFYKGSEGGASPAFRLYYLHLNSKPNGGMYPPALTNPSEKNMTYYGSFSGSDQYNINALNLTAFGQTPVYYFAIFMPNGTFVAYSSIYLSQLYSHQQAATFFFQTEMVFMGLFVPLLASVSAYTIYGRDRAGGVLESVLVRPVTRKALLFSRYLANTLTVFISILVSLVATSLLFYHYLGVFLPQNVLLLGLWAMLVGIAGFIGLVYLASNYIKSQGALIGFSVGIFVVLDLFWTSPLFPVIPASILSGLLGLSAGQVLYAKAYAIMFLASPAGYSNAASFLVSGTAGFGYYLGNFTAEQIGLTILRVVSLGLLWIVVPIVGALLSITRKD